MEENWELTLDLNYFAVDSDGHIICVFSGGMQIPKSVSSNEEDWDPVWSFFENLENNGSEFTLGPHPLVSVQELPLGARKGDPTVQSNDNYYGLAYAEKGLFVFDYDIGKHHKNPLYFLAAAPTTPLKVSDLPESISKIVNRTVIQGSILGRTSVTLEEIS